MWVSCLWVAGYPIKPAFLLFAPPWLSLYRVARLSASGGTDVRIRVAICELNVEVRHPGYVEAALVHDFREAGAESIQAAIQGATVRRREDFDETRCLEPRHCAGPMPDQRRNARVNAVAPE
jgi:hypothetical protein